MKRFFSLLAALCIFLNAIAQDKRTDKSAGTGAAGNLIGAKGLQIGQQVPDVLITHVSGLKLKGKAVNAFRFSELQGKLVILDFWATWCAPCRAMVPVMDSLQRVFAGKVVFLPVAYQSQAQVAPVLAAMQHVRPFDLPGVTDDQVLKKLFPHRTLPHYVWIDAAGRVRAVTEEKEVTAVNINRMLLGAGSGLAAKQDLSIPYDRELPLFTGGNTVAGLNLRYHSLLAGYVPGLPPGMDIFPADSIKGQRFNVRNVPLTWLFRMAYSDHNRWFSGPNVRLLSADSGRIDTKLTGKDYEDWLARGNGWCYELLVPPALIPDAYTLMQEDIARMFPHYRVGVKLIQTRCLVLVRTSTEDKLASRGGAPSAEVSPYSCELRNTGLGQLVKRLQVQYMQNAPIPVVDGTGYTGRIDLSLRAPLSDVAALNKELARYDLRFVEQEAAVDLLIVRDREQMKTNTNP